MIQNKHLSEEQSVCSSDDLMQLLRKKVVRNENEEILEYLDYLIPEYEIPIGTSTQHGESRRVYDWSEFMDFQGEEFVRKAFLCLLKREADPEALRVAADYPGSDESSRLIMLGNLRYSEECCAAGIQVDGLWTRYKYHLSCRDRKTLRRIFFGCLVRFEGLFRSKEQALLAIHQREVSEFGREIGELEMRLKDHYNDSVKHIKRELAAAFEADINR